MQRSGIRIGVNEGLEDKKKIGSMNIAATGGPRCLCQCRNHDNGRDLPAIGSLKVSLSSCRFERRWHELRASMVLEANQRGQTDVRND